MPKNQEPKTCCVKKANGQVCGGTAMFRVGVRGFCEGHKQVAINARIHSAGPRAWKGPVPE